MRRSASEIIRNLEQRIARLEHHKLSSESNQFGSVALWEQNVKRYPKYLASIRKSLKPLGFVFGRVQKFNRMEQGRGNVGVSMPFEFQGETGLIFIDQGFEGFYGSGSGERNSRLTIRLGKQIIFTVDGTNKKHIGYHPDTGMTFSDLTDKDVKLFISKVETYFTTSDKDRFNDIKSLVKSLWSKNRRGDMTLKLPNKEEYIVHEGKGRAYGYKEEGYYIQLKSPKISMRYDWIIDASGEEGKKKAMTESQAIKMAEELAIESLLRGGVY